MNSRQYLGIFLATVLFAFSGAYLGSRTVPLQAQADPAVGNGSGGSTTTGSSQTGVDPGGGLCVTGGAVALCNPITGTITDSNATPLAFTNTTGPTIITSAATTGAAFSLNGTGPTTGDLFELKKSGSICVLFDQNGNMTFGTNCANLNLQLSGHFITNAGSACTGATPQTARMACRITSSSSSATLNFTNAFTSTPVCVATDETATNTTRVTPGTTNVVITNSGATDSDVIDVACFGNGP